MNLNRIEVEGLIGSGGELRQAGEHPILNFSLAWNDYRNGKAGPTTWFRVNVWGKYAESLQNQIEKGQKVLVIGRCELRTFKKKDGTEAQSLEITAEQVKFLVKPQRRQQDDAPAYDEGGGWGG